MEALMDLEVQTLSGGELQRVAITLALGKPADVSLSFSRSYSCSKIRL